MWDGTPAKSNENRVRDGAAGGLEIWKSFAKGLKGWSIAAYFRNERPAEKNQGFQVSDPPGEMGKGGGEEGICDP
jgi:hypothetical protein